MKVLKIFLLIAVYCLPVLAAFEAYRFTDHYFQIQKIPLPFEKFGIACALGTGFITLGIVQLLHGLVRTIKNNRGGVMKKRLLAVFVVIFLGTMVGAAHAANDNGDVNLANESNASRNNFSTVDNSQSGNFQQVIEKQNQILHEIEAIKAELQIIKVRVSLKN